MILMKIDANKPQRLGYWLGYDGGGLSFAAANIAGILAFSCIFAGMPLWANVSVVLGIFVSIIIPVASILGGWYLYWTTQKAKVYGENYVYKQSEQRPMFRATRYWYDMNTDNREIATPLVKRVYELWPQTAADGSRLYSKAVDKALDALDKLYVEQVATEKALADAKSKAQYSSVESIDNDVQRVLDYAEAMKQVRKDFTTKMIEVAQ